MNIYTVIGLCLILICKPINSDRPTFHKHQTNLFFLKKLILDELTRIASQSNSISLILKCFISALGYSIKGVNLEWFRRILFLL